MLQYSSKYDTCSVIDHEVRHNIVKVAVDPRDDSIYVLRTVKYLHVVLLSVLLLSFPITRC